MVKKEHEKQLAGATRIVKSSRSLFNILLEIYIFLNTWNGMLTWLVVNAEIRTYSNKMYKINSYKILPQKLSSL